MVGKGCGFFYCLIKEICLGQQGFLRAKEKESFDKCVQRKDHKKLGKVLEGQLILLNTE